MDATRARKLLLLQGGLILTAGLIAGLPMAEAIESNATDAVRAWRVVHVGGVTGALLLMAFGLAVSDLRLGSTLPLFVVLSAASTYLLTIGLLLAAMSGERGIGPSEETGVGGIVELCYEIGALGILIAVGQFLVGITLGLREARAPAERGG